MNVYALRFPREKDFIRRVSDKLIIHAENDFRSGFVFSPFLNSDRIFKIADGSDLERIPSELILENAVEFPETVTTKEGHRRYIEDIVHSLADNENGKIVAARTLRLKAAVDPEKMLKKLAGAYPDAFIFFLSTKEFGSWIGASPELLMERRGNSWETMALAGTRPAGSPLEWDSKNRVEQQIVEDYIRELFTRNGLEIIQTEKSTVVAGPVEHIKTQFKAFGNPKSGGLNFVSEFSPTPALCGYPKDLAIKTIKKWEGESRRLYGGFVGWYENQNTFRLFVNLRSALVNPDEIMLYAGGGITKDSLPESEWEETERKLSTLKNIL